MSDEGKKTPAPPTSGEIATITNGRDITRGFVSPELYGGLLYPQDLVLRSRGGDYRTYEWVLQDDQVFSTFQQRRRALVSREWEVEAASDSPLDVKAADSLRAQLKAIDWDGKTDKMLHGLFYGFAVGECLWDRNGAEIVLADIKVRKQRRFKFGYDGQPRLITFQSPLGEALPPQKFWTFCTGADNDDEPYGLGLAHWLFWPVFFKRNDIKYWLIFLEKFGQPTTVGKYPTGSLLDEQQRLLAACRAVATETSVVIPEAMEITLLEAARSGAGDYQAMHDAMNAAISKVVLSQTMTTDDGSSLAQGQVHADVKDEVVKGDDDLISGSFTRSVATWLTEWNFPGAATPRVYRRVEGDPDLKPQADRDLVIYQMGYEPTEEYIQQTYGDGFVKRQAPPAPQPGMFPFRPGSFQQGGGDGGDPAFASPAARAPDVVDGFAARAGVEGSAAIGAMVAAVRKVFADAGSLEEARDRIIELYPRLDAVAFADLMQRAVTASDLAGRYEVRSGQ